LKDEAFIKAKLKRGKEAGDKVRLEFSSVLMLSVMRTVQFNKITSLVQLFEILPEEERVIVDVLRQIILENLPATCKEKISCNVPFFYGKRGICIIWPATIPYGGIKEGVLLGFWYGNRLKDEDNYLTRGTNKQVYYKIFKKAEEIDERPIVRLLKQAVTIGLQ
jgi:hypothetical protein